MTPIRHCNINQHGRICHSVLDRNWTSDTTMRRVFECIFGLLLSPDTADPLDSTLALSFYEADGSYEAAILAHTKLHATKITKAEWAANLEHKSSIWPEQEGAAQALKGKAAECAGRKNWAEARTLWRLALATIDYGSAFALAPKIASAAAAAELAAVLHCNLAAAALELGNTTEAEEASTASLALITALGACACGKAAASEWELERQADRESLRAKALLRRGRARTRAGKFSVANDDLQAARELRPKDPSVKDALKQLKEATKQSAFLYGKFHA